MEKYRLVVATADVCIRHYDVMTHKLISEIWPTPPAGGADVSLFSLAV